MHPIENINLIKRFVRERTHICRALYIIEPKIFIRKKKNILLISSYSLFWSFRTAWQRHTDNFNEIRRKTNHSGHLCSAINLTHTDPICSVHLWNQWSTAADSHNTASNGKLQHCRRFLHISISARRSPNHCSPSFNIQRAAFTRVQITDFVLRALSYHFPHMLKTSTLLYTLWELPNPFSAYR